MTVLKFMKPISKLQEGLLAKIFMNDGSEKICHITKIKYEGVEHIRVYEKHRKYQRKKPSLEMNLIKGFLPVTLEEYENY